MALSPVLAMARPVGSAGSSGMWLWMTLAPPEPVVSVRKYFVPVPTAPTGGAACGCTA